ncbi:hypothetical protein CIB84_016585 [Bambusicola thoracicus]|uniref:Uncharacterized protein n=1 Tax=Bambusicola thoracicus TaxID=9083 RepID=A0A2P4S6B9_BAMTH|nr:hypothetical protein CIB84_016585 [Bambusicola thoracicus]
MWMDACSLPSTKGYYRSALLPSISPHEQHTTTSQSFVNRDHQAVKVPLEVFALAAIPHWHLLHLIHIKGVDNIVKRTQSLNKNGRHQAFKTANAHKAVLRTACCYSS